jgi:hypothetical protein
MHCPLRRALAFVAVGLAACTSSSSADRPSAKLEPTATSSRNDVSATKPERADAGVPKPSRDGIEILATGQGWSAAPGRVQTSSDIVIALDLLPTQLGVTIDDGHIAVVVNHPTVDDCPTVLDAMTIDGNTVSLEWVPALPGQPCAVRSGPQRSLLRIDRTYLPVGAVTLDTNSIGALLPTIESDQTHGVETPATPNELDAISFDNPLRRDPTSSTAPGGT